MTTGPRDEVARAAAAAAAAAASDGVRDDHAGDMLDGDTLDGEHPVTTEPPPMPGPPLMPSSPEIWIADEAVIYLRPGGTRVPGRIAIAAPHRVEDADHHGCTISLEGMRDDFTAQPRPVVIFGETPLQALVLAMRFMGRMLRVFHDRGGRVLYIGGEGDDDGVGDVEMPLDAFFGPLLADRGPT